MKRTAKAEVVPVRQRTQYTCMSTSMMMCLQALGHECDEDEVNKVMGARPMKGASWEQALACAQHYGCRATLTMPSTVSQLKEWTDKGVPVMIAWNPEGRDWSHASVVFDVTEEDGEVYVHVADPNIPDPEETVRKVTKGEFYSKWSEKWPNYLVRRPACAIEREITPKGRQVMASNKTALSPVAKTILDQMGGMRRLQMMIGARDFVYGPNSISFRWPNKQRSKGNLLKVTLRGDDTYKVEFMNVAKYNAKVVKKHEGVYAEDLVDIFERQTGWYLRMGSEQRIASRVAEKFLQAGVHDHLIFHVDDKGNVWAPDRRTGKPIVGRPYKPLPAGVHTGNDVWGVAVNWKANVSGTYNVREWKEYYTLWAEYLELYGNGWEEKAPLVLSAKAKFRNGFPPKNLRRALGRAKPSRFPKTDLKSAVAKLRAERERQSLVTSEDLALFQKLWRGKSELNANLLWRDHKDAVEQWLWLGWVKQTSRQITNRDNPYRERTQTYGWEKVYALTKEGQKALQMSDEDLVGYKPRLVPKKPEAPKAPEPAPTAPSSSEGGDPKLKAKRLEVLSIVLNKYPDDSFLQGMRKLIENDRPLSDKQLSAIRRKLYMSRMKPEADHFRTAAHMELMARAKKKKKPKSMKDRMKIDKTKPKTRNTLMKDMAEGKLFGGGAAGKHHTRDRDVAKGRSRKPKHKKRYDASTVNQGKLSSSSFEDWLDEVADYLKQDRMTLGDAVRNRNTKDAIRRVWYPLFRSGARPADAVEDHFGETYDGVRFAHYPFNRTTLNEAACRLANAYLGKQENSDD